MHSYGTDSKHISHIHFGIGIAAYSLYVAVAQLLGLAAPYIHLSVHVAPISTLTIFGILEFLFNWWGWRLLCRLPGTHVYDFAGSYEGDIVARDGTKYPAKLAIKQNWSRIAIDFESGQATSKSFSASIVRDRLATGQIEIVYNYYAPGTHDGEERVGAHHGTAILKRSRDGKRIEGDYYTEQKRDSSGSIFLRRAV